VAGLLAPVAAACQRSSIGSVAASVPPRRSVRLAVPRGRTRPRRDDPVATRPLEEFALEVAEEYASPAEAGPDEIVAGPPADGSATKTSPLRASTTIPVPAGQFERRRRGQRSRPNV